LAANGIAVEIAGDDLLVRGTGRPPAGGGLVATEMDHRIAMSALVLGLATEAPVAIDDSAFIETSFPGFVKLMNAAGAAIVTASAPAPPECGGEGRGEVGRP
jgi:3-phosphoshikimate 1-carboxyvinyltransferase